MAMAPMMMLKYTFSTLPAVISPFSTRLYAYQKASAYMHSTSPIVAPMPTPIALAFLMPALYAPAKKKAGGNRRQC